MRTRLGFFLTVITLFGVFALQMVFIFVNLNSSIVQSAGGGTGFFQYLYISITRLIIATLIWIERKNLEQFHVDKFTIVTLLVGFFLFQRVGGVGENFFIVVIGITGVSLIILLMISKPQIPSTRIRLALIGIVAGSVLVIVLTLLEILLRPPWPPQPLTRGNLIATCVGYIIREISTVPMEEMMFRGFLWGYLSRKGWREKKIFWTQGLLFWLLHFLRIGMPFSFFIAIPLLTLLSSELVKRTKQLFPSILAHIVINSISALLNLSTF